VVAAERLVKNFTLHHSGPATIRALCGVSLEVPAGSALGLTGPSGSGKSSLLRCLYGNYRIDGGEARVRHLGAMVDLSTAPDRLILEIRAKTVGYVSQFLRVIPRVPALEVVAEPLSEAGVEPAVARAEAALMLERLNVPRRLWGLAPATFSGGERQRVNIARVLARHWPILLLDEPTASLDAANREVVAELVLEAKARGSAVVGVFHDLDFLARVADRSMRLDPPEAARE
jgi:alpha-D-ribose 1-methylphosphonate 5-triphosphate synthase subunit PhnL